MPRRRTPTAGGLPRYEVEDLELPTGMGQVPRQVMQDLQITQCNGVVPERKRLVVVFSAKDGGVSLGPWSVLNAQSMIDISPGVHTAGRRPR